MFHKISTWVLVLLAASDVLASPLLSSTYKQSPEPHLIDRQFDCPPGVECGHGPECTPELCDLPGCADAEVCQDNSDKKRNAAATLAGRQFDCPPGVECGPGPECTSQLCDLPGCADADVCQVGSDKKRSAETDVVHPICDICTVDDNGTTVCGCATPGEGVGRRAAEQFCPEYCIITEDGETLCGCAAEAYEKSLQGNESGA